MDNANIENKVPGAIRVEAAYSIHSKEAKNLYYGRKESKDTKQSNIIGVHHLSFKLQTIVAGARSDDPYADYFLYHIESLFEKTSKSLEQIFSDLEQLKPEGVELNFRSSDPIAIRTSFSTVYANLAMQILTLSDKIFLLIHALQHIGQLDRQAANALLEGTKTKKGLKQIVRGCFEIASSGYKQTGITRKDLDLMTARTKMAFESMAVALKHNDHDELPKCIIDKTCRAKHAPNIRVVHDLASIMMAKSDGEDNGSEDNE